jgi:hypothetical protein
MVLLNVIGQPGDHRRSLRTLAGRTRHMRGIVRGACGPTRTQPSDRARRLRGQRLPPGDGSGALARLGVVGDSWKPPARLYAADSSPSFSIDPVRGVDYGEGEKANGGRLKKETCTLQHRFVYLTGWQPPLSLLAYPTYRIRF